MIYQPPFEQSDWSECCNHGRSYVAHQTSKLVELRILPRRTFSYYMYRRDSGQRGTCSTSIYSDYDRSDIINQTSVSELTRMHKG